MKENELIIGNWYKIKTTDMASHPGDEYFFKCKRDKSGDASHHMSITIKNLSGSGNLTQSNSAFKGNDYTLCNQEEILWCESCLKQNRYIPFNKNDYQTEPQFDLIF